MTLDYSDDQQHYRTCPGSHNLVKVRFWRTGALLCPASTNGGQFWMLLPQDLMKRHLLLACLLAALSLRPCFADEPKYHDKDLIYDEAHVPAYDLPPLLVSTEGKPITTVDEWFNVRRPQIMSLLGNLLYGVVPEPESPLKMSCEVVKTDRQFMDGAGTRKDVWIRFEMRRARRR